MTTTAPPAPYLDNAQRPTWENWVMGQLMQMWAQQARSEWVGHDFKEIRNVAHR